MKTKSLFLFLLLALSVMPLRSQVRNEALGALRVDCDPVRLALAGAGSSVTETGQAFTAFYNPAAAAFSSSKVEAGFSYASWSPRYSHAPASGRI